jgi:hypothetical protein
MFNFFRFQENYERQKKLKSMLESPAEVTIEEILDFSESADELKSDSSSAVLL